MSEEQQSTAATPSGEPEMTEPPTTADQAPSPEQQPTAVTPSSEPEMTEPSTTVDQDPSPEQQPEAGQAPDAEQTPLAETQPAPEGPSAADDEKASKSKYVKPRLPKRDPEYVADYFKACPRCSFFLAGYGLIFHDFDEIASSDTGDWLDLSWNLAVRNLLGKSYGYDLAEPLLAFRGVCPSCQRAFSYDAGDEDQPNEHFTIQINPRTS